MIRIYERKNGLKEKLVWLLNRMSVLMDEDGLKAINVQGMRNHFKDKLDAKFSKESRRCRVSTGLVKTLYRSWCG